MPVYEFYCANCHTIFNFLAHRVNIDRRPACPKCGRLELERQVSRFAVSKGRKDAPAEGMPDLDEARMEKAMMSLAGELEGMDENDPRQMARFMRKLTDASGMKPGPGIEEAISRLEAGEDPEQIEAELGDLVDAETPFTRQGVRVLKRKLTPPAHDDTLYVL